MKQAKIGQLKDHLSRFLEHVRAGGEVLVLDRDRPVARLVPLPESGPAGGLDEERLSRLERSGLIRRGTGGVPGWLGKRRPVRLRGSVVKDLLAERKAGW